MASDEQTRLGDEWVRQGNRARLMMRANRSFRDPSRRHLRFAAPDKRRPVLVLGRSDVLPSLSQVPVIPLSTQARALAWEVPLSMDDGLPSPCVLKPEPIERFGAFARTATVRCSGASQKG
jgi:hypothetical protein